MPIRPDLHSQADFSLLTTKVPFSPDRLESHTPVEEEYPTQALAKLTRGAAQERHWDVAGPVQVLHAGEQLLDQHIVHAMYGQHTSNKWKMTSPSTDPVDKSGAIYILEHLQKREPEV
jgi:hypothetical protein